MKVSCSKSHERRWSEEYSQEIEGICISCDRCDNSQFSFGTHKESTDRCLTLLNESCPKDENNYYELNTGGGASTDEDGAIPLASLKELRQYKDINAADRHTIATAVQDWGGAPHEFTLWLPEWLAKKKPLVPEDRSTQVFTGICDHETDKAWLIKQKPYSVEEWVPKSVAYAFRRGSGFSLNGGEETPECEICGVFATHQDTESGEYACKEHFQEVVK